MNKIHIGQTLYIVYADTLIEKIVEGLSVEKGGISGRLNWIGNDGRSTYIIIVGEEISGSYNYAYNRSETFYAFLNKSDAAKFQREKILRINEDLKESVENQMRELKKFRIKHFEILNSTDTDKWVQNFEAEYKW